MDTKNTPRARLTLTSIAALASAGALAQEPNPYYIGASQSVARESNLFRSADGVRVSDTVSVTSLLAGLDQPIGRQRLFADAAVRSGRFADNSQLNYTGGSLLAGADWEAAESLSGRLSYGIDRRLAPTGLDLGIDPTLRNVQTTQEFVLRGQSSTVAVFAVEAGYIHRALDYTAVAANDLEFKQDTGSLGLRFRPGGALTLGLTVRRTEGTYPFAAAGDLPDDFQRDDVDLSAVWIATGASTVTARLSRTREKHEVLTTRDVSGNTGALSWNFKPTGKLNLTADYIRDTGAESTFIGTGGAGGGGSATPVVNSSPQATTWQLRGDYEVTAKVQLVAFVRHLKRDLVNNAAIPGTGEDTLVEARAGLNWTPLRSVLVGCTVGREDRDASEGAVANVLSSSYSATTVRCLAQFRTQ
ncbi:MAG: hypothetical protein HZC37_31970 [Burkholderiales bacterium]|nr:hypothetical protein [Burkholderiales bacterium]